MEEKLKQIRAWLGTGMINIFGLPFAGKDTVGIRLAEDLGAKFLSSGLILRSAQESDPDLAKELNAGLLANTDKFREIVLPYLSRSDLRPFPLVLSSVGRWQGEEQAVMAAADFGGHPAKAVILLNISEAEAQQRWETAQVTMDRGTRLDDKKGGAILEQRIAEFRTKTMPVVEFYQRAGLLLPIPAQRNRDEVYAAVVDALYSKSLG